MFCLETLSNFILHMASFIILEFLWKMWEKLRLIEFQHEKQNFFHDFQDEKFFFLKKWKMWKSIELFFFEHEWFKFNLYQTIQFESAFKSLFLAYE